MNVISPHLPPHLAPHITPSEYNPFDVVESAIANAFDSLKFNQSVADTVAAHLVRLKPDLNGNVHDETGGRVDRVQLAGRASTFNGSNQCFTSNVSIASGQDALTFVVWAKTTANNDDVFTQYETNTDDRSFRLNFQGTGEIQAVISGDGTYDSVSTKRANTVAAFNDGEWHHIVVTWSAESDQMRIYVDGKEQALTVGADASIATVYTSSTNILVGGRFNVGSPVALFNGQLQLPAIWYAELTAANVRDLYLEKYSKVTRPDLAWLLDGSNAPSLVGGSALNPQFDPTLYQDAEVPVDWLNDFGWNLGNKGRFKRTLVNNESVTFEVQTTDTSFNFLNDSGGNFAGLVFNSTGGLGSVRDITIDGVLFTGTTRGELKDAVADGTKHIVEVKISSSSWSDTEWGNFGGAYELSTGYCKPTHINGVAITDDDIDFANTTVIAPKAWGATEDTDGYSGGTLGKEAKCQGQLIDGPCLAFTGSEYATNANLTGSETVASSEGTSTPTISAGRIDFTAGTCWNLVLSNGSHYPMSEEAGPTAHDVENGYHLALISEPAQGLQDTFFWSDNKGCSAVPVFDGAYGIAGTNHSFLGRKSAEVEVDIFHSVDDGPQCIFSLGSVSPFRVYISGNNLQINGRDSGNNVVSYNVVSMSVGSLYKFRIEIVEDDLAPTTASYIRVYDQDSGVLLGEATGLDLVMSNDNTARPLIGIYQGDRELQDDVYRIKMSIEGVEVFHWFANDPLNNQTADDLAFTVSGGALQLKKIPAQTADPSKDVNGYELSMPAGPHINSQASLKICNVDESPSTAARFYSARFSGVANADIKANTNITGFPFSISATIRNQNSGTQYYVFLNEDTSKYFGLVGQTTSGFRVQRRRTSGSVTTIVSAAFSQDEWHDIKAEFHDATSFSFTLDGVTTLYDGLDSVDAPLAGTEGLLLGKFRTSTTTSPNHDIKNVVVEQGGVAIIQMPAYGNSLELVNANNGTDTDVTYLSESELVVQLADYVSNTHHHERDSLGRITKSIVLAG